MSQSAVTCLSDERLVMSELCYGGVVTHENLVTSTDTLGHYCIQVFWDAVSLG